LVLAYLKNIMPIKYISPLSLLFIFCMGCNDFKSSEKITIGKYALPNIDSLITAQTDVLNTKAVVKKVKLNDKTESLNLVSDASFWKSELSVFSELEINKNSLIGAYNTLSTGEFQLTFDRKVDENRGADLVKIKRSESGALLQLSGTIRAVNYLYSSEQVLVLGFNENSGLIENYSFSGFQKLISKDTVFFEIEGTVQ
jgi:hypothetical protein